METCQRILITPGEPAGVGPELVVRLAQQTHAHELTAIADADLLVKTAAHLKLPLTIKHLDIDAPPQPHKTSELMCIHTKLKAPSQFGKLDSRNAAYVVNCLQQANDLCLTNKAAAVVTGPVQKSIINDAGIAFSGHTEFFAEQSNTRKVVMMLATEGLKVALVTTHIPLKDVAEAITAIELEQVSTILYNELKTKFGIHNPRILVCGLNPHAGEGGHLGREEIDTIIPVLNTLKQKNIHLIGPLPADTLFCEKHLKNADAVLAMYHDQGLPVLKHKGFGQAVNITLGLPYIRTSVDHGTALDLAGLGTADLGSMNVALHYAIHMAQKNIG